jgi:hypothetical protein
MLRSVGISLVIACSLLATGCGGSGQGFTAVYDNPRALTSSLGCTFDPDEAPVPATAASGSCDLRDAPIKILFFNSQNDRGAFRRENELKSGRVVEGSNFLLIARTTEQVRWATDNLVPGSVR